MTAIFRVSDTEHARTITLGAPARVFTLSSSNVQALIQATSPTALDGKRVLVFRSEHKTFCAGFDLRESTSPTPAEIRFLRIQELLDQVASAKLITVSLVNGAAIGAGADLAAVCAYRVGSPTASLSFPGSRFGVILGTDRLAQISGPSVALDIALRNTRVYAQEALQQGLLTHLVPERELLDFVDTLITDMSDITLSTVQALVEATRGVPSGVTQQRLVTSLLNPDFVKNLAEFSQGVWAKLDTQSS